MPIIVAARHVYLLLHLKKEKGSTVPFSMAIGNELVQECFPQTLTQGNRNYERGHRNGRKRKA